MIYKDRTYRTTEETSTSNPTLEGRLAALDNFSGGTSITEEIRTELNVEKPAEPAPEVTEVNGTADINSTLEPPAPDVETPAVEAPPAAEAPEASEATETPSVKIESEMFEGGARDLTGGKPVEEIKLSEDAAKYITDLGFETPSELSSALQQYKEQGTQIAELETKIANNDEIYKQMPKEMYNAVTAYFNGDKDWKNHVNNDGLDYTQDFSSLDKKNIIDNYYPNQFSADDWEEYNDVDGDVNVKKAIDIALGNSSSQFESKKNEVINYQSSVAQKNAQTMEAVDHSIKQTMSNLPSQMEGLSDAYVKSIESKIRNNEILGLFYNEDGSLKPDAAHRLLMAQDGSNLLSQYEQLYKVQASNEATQEILDRSSDTPNLTQGGSSTVAAEQKSTVQQSIEAMEARHIKKNTF